MPYANQPSVTITGKKLNTVMLKNSNNVFIFEILIFGSIKVLNRFFFKEPRFWNIESGNVVDCYYLFPNRIE